MSFLLTTLYEYEININRNIQLQFQFAEPLLRHINDYLDPFFILNFWIPLVGSFKHKLLVQLVTSVSLVTTICSVIKWCSPEFRPIWWIKENSANNKYSFNDLEIDPYSCDTSAGFPSTHSATFTTFCLILVWSFVKSFLSSFDFVLIDKYLLIYAVVSLFSTFMWSTRLYFLYEFLHQCIIGSMIAAGMIHIFKHYSTTLLNLGKLKALLLVLGFGLMPLSMYFGMLNMDVDPFWSVRMAFKWCPDPLYLKHESTPVFTLFRDFGYLMGLALSCPLAQSYKNPANNYRKRIPVVIIMEIVNGVIRSYTPKQYGRFAFVSYEFLRNCCHSFMLLNVLPKFV